MFNFIKNKLAIRQNTKRINKELELLSKETLLKQKELESQIGKTCRLYTDEDYQKIAEYVEDNVKYLDETYLKGFKFGLSLETNYYKDIQLRLHDGREDMYMEEFVEHLKNLGYRARMNSYSNRYDRNYKGQQYRGLYFVLSISKKDLNRHQGLKNLLNDIYDLKMKHMEDCEHKDTISKEKDNIRKMKNKKYVEENLI